MKELETLRGEIDAIDDELIALLKKRIGVVQQVGELKRKSGEKGVFIRPGREGRMHERIHAAFKDTPYPPEAMLGIWRLLISASTHHESSLSLGVLNQPEEPEIAGLAREYFGAFLERRNYSNAGSLLADLHDGRISIGIVPFPRNEHAWWQQLAQYQDAQCFIFARLPIMQTSPRDDAAMAIGMVTPEPSGHDQSYFMLNADETVSTSKLHSWFDKAGLEAEFINAAMRPPRRSVLVRIEGFFNDESDAINALRAQLEDADIIFLGAHPKAIAPEAS